MPWNPARQRSVSTALAIWLITVAKAAPATPQWNPAMKTTSSTMLTRDATMRK